jgi:hypothetical protein
LLYAEDATWSGLGLTRGWTWTLFNAKSDYYVFLNIALLWLASFVSKAVAGNVIELLPLCISFFAIVFYAAFSAACFNFLKARFGVIVGLTGAIFITFLPMGESVNEIIGRVSNIGYLIFPFSAILMIFYFSKKISTWQFCAIIICQILFALTNPLVSLLTIFLIVINLRKQFPSRITHRETIFIGVSILTLFLNMQKVLMSQNESTITGSFVWTNAVKVFIGREIVYPLSFPIYTSLNDFWVLGIAVIFIVLVILGRYKASRNERTEIDLLLAALVLNILATGFMRRSLTQQITSYDNTFPDRYFIGSNYLVFLIVIYVFCILFKPILKDKLTANRMMSNWILFLFSLNLVFSPGIIQFSQTSFPIGTKSDFIFSVCNPVEESANSSVLVLNMFPTGWNMAIMKEQLEMYRIEKCR